MRRKTKLLIYLLIGIVSICLGLSLSAWKMSRGVESPEYVVSKSQGNIEIRQYPAIIIAQVSVTGERDEAIRSGFRLLADYIFGNNSSQQTIEMTAPVQQQQDSAESEKIAMTAPVLQQAEGEETIAENTEWKVSFVMPSEYTMETLPMPNNERVIIRALDSKNIAAITFTGFHSNDNLHHHERELMQYLVEQGLMDKAEPIYAFYDHPSVLPFMRKNEVLIEIE